VRRQHGTAAIAEAELASSAAPLRQPIRVGERQHLAALRNRGLRLHFHAELPPPILRRLLDARALAAIQRRIVGIAAQQLHAMTQVGIALAPLQQIALAQDRGDVAGEIAEPAFLRPHHHVGKARMHAELGHAAAVRRCEIVGIDRFQLPQQRSGL
jgi:hypothetical protein